MFYAGQRVLVTGGLGFIGSNLAVRQPLLARIRTPEDGGRVRFRPFPVGRQAIDIGSLRTGRSVLRAALDWKLKGVFQTGARPALACFRQHRQRSLS